jgi:hypothetical protein
MHEELSNRIREWNADVRSQFHYERNSFIYSQCNDVQSDGDDASRRRLGLVVGSDEAHYSGD